jgi:hypothetical protein
MLTPLVVEDRIESLCSTELEIKCTKLSLFLALLLQLRVHEFKDLFV